MRRPIGLLALLAVLGALAVSAAGAAAKEAPHRTGDGAIIFYKPNLAPFAESDCPGAIGPNWESYMCAWQGTEWGGQLSYWPQGNKGCHNHVNNPNLRSFWNRTPYNVRIGGWGVLGPGLGLQMTPNTPITGELCWPV